MPRLLDLFCGRWGWSKAFAARGWECVGVDLVEPPDTPCNCTFWATDVSKLTAKDLWGFDFVVASSPCQQFSVHGMKHFHPNPPWPALGIELFNHTRSICEASGLPYVMENVRPAQKFVGRASHHCGPFFLWGNAVPPLIGWENTNKAMSQNRKRDANGKRIYVGNDALGKKERAANSATIPPELANCVADYAERLLEMKVMA